MISESLDRNLLCREVCREPVKGLVFLGVNSVTHENSQYVQEGETTITLAHRYHAAGEFHHLVTLAVGSVTLTELIRDLEAARVALEGNDQEGVEIRST